MAILVKVGARGADDEEEPSGFFSKMSIWLYDNYGTAGYSEMLPITFTLIFKGIREVLNEYLFNPFKAMF